MEATGSKAQSSTSISASLKSMPGPFPHPHQSPPLPPRSDRTQLKSDWSFASIAPPHFRRVVQFGRIRKPTQAAISKKDFLASEYR